MFKPRIVKKSESETVTVVAPRLEAAKGDDQLMSKQPMDMPSSDEMKGRWKQMMGEAKIAWGKITDDELLQVEGHAQKLTGFVQERYALSRDEAERQVKSFFDKHKAHKA